MNPGTHENEHHLIERSKWLRAAVLGANDGIISTGSILIGVASAASPHNAIVLTGVAAVIAGALSMAAGEYVSVSTQSDIEKRDIAIESAALRDFACEELQELAAIYHARGVDKDLSFEVARQLSEKDALAAHIRDELGLTSTATARPVQAAFASAVSFFLGALIPLLSIFLAPKAHLVLSIATVSVLALAILGYVSARAGGSRARVAISRIVFWGALAMGLTGLLGWLFGVAL